MILLALIVLLALLVFYGVLQTELSGLIKFLLVVLEMIIVSQIFIKKYKLPTELGLVLLKSDKGLKTIDGLAKNKKSWEFFSDMGSTISYGLMSTMLMRKNTSWKSVLAGMAFLLIITLFIAPLAMEFLRVVLSGTSILEKEQMVIFFDAETTALLLFAVLLLGGFFAVLLLSIVYYGIYVFLQIAEFLISGADISSTSPGGTLLLPGVNLPFFEGILALIAILIVHEVSHAVLARIAKVPIKSSGMVFFGIIPMGAFVEPDEKKLERVDRIRQTRVLVAGPTANFVSSVAFFILFVVLLLLLRSAFVAEGSLLYSVLKFLNITAGLAFSLNFVVATVNLLPLPVFDGYRLLEINVPNKQIVKAVMIITLAAFIMNFIPWFFIT
jgi:Zn-dependent protease